MRYENLPTNLKIISLLSLLAIASGGGAIYASVQMSAIDANYSALIDGPDKGNIFASRARRALAEVIGDIYRNATATNEAENVAALAETKSDEADFLELIGQAKEKLPAFEGRIEEQERAFKALMSGDCGETIRLANDLKDPSGNEKAVKLMNSSCMSKLTAVNEALRIIVDDSQKAVDTSSDAATEHTNFVRNLLLAIVGVSTVLIFGLATWVTRRFIAMPLADFQVTMTAIGQGKLDVEVSNTHRSDEVGAIAKNLNELKAQLTEAQRLRSEQAKAQAEREERNRLIAAAVQKFESVIGGVVGTVSSASGQLEEAAVSLTKTASTTQQLSTTVASASEQTSANVQGVAAASEELASTVSEIARQVQESANITGQAVEQAAKTNEQVAQLSHAANRIGDVVNLINTIAGQTNLLALNATIEAARAGDAGKGFAVVAQEVKALAAQTAKATNEIAAQISGMQSATNVAVNAIEEIGLTINKVNSISGAIAAAVEEQEATTKEITRNVTEAAKGTSEVANNITDVNNGAVATGSASSQVLASAKQLAGESNNLKRAVDEFLTSIRAA